MVRQLCTRNGSQWSVSQLFTVYLVVRFCRFADVSQSTKVIYIQYINSLVEFQNQREVVEIAHFSFSISNHLLLKVDENEDILFNKRAANIKLKETGQ